MNSVTSSGPDLYAQTCHRIRKAMGEFNDDNQSIESLVSSLAEKSREYAAHLARQSEGVSDEIIWKAARALFNARKNNLPLGVDRENHWNKEKGNYFIDAQCALTAVWHNQPAQEKVEPVAWGVRDKNEEIWVWDPGIATLTKDSAENWIEWAKDPSRKNTHPWIAEASPFKLVEFYTAPPAERVRVPSGWKLVPIKMTEEMQRAGSGFNYIENAWNAVLNAAPEADHD